MSIFNKILIWVISFMIMWMPIQSLAQSFDIPVDLPPGLDPVVPMYIGETVGQEGILFPTKTATVLFAEIEFEIKKKDLELITTEKKIKEKYEFQIQLLTQRYEFMDETYKTRITFLEDRLDTCEDEIMDAGFDWDVVWFVGGFVLGAATAVGVFYAVNQ